jgi:hypothetical protein
MKRKLKIFLCVSAVEVLVSSATVVGLMRSQELLAAEQVSQQQPIQSLAERRAQLARQMTGEQLGPKIRTAEEACAQGVGADYSDDPERAYAWIRTLCNR